MNKHARVHAWKGTLCYYTKSWNRPDMAAMQCLIIFFTVRININCEPSNLINIIHRHAIYICSNIRYDTLNAVVCSFFEFCLGAKKKSFVYIKRCLHPAGMAENKWGRRQSESRDHSLTTFHSHITKYPANEFFFSRQTINLIHVIFSTSDRFPDVWHDRKSQWNSYFKRGKKNCPLPKQTRIAFPEGITYLQLATNGNDYYTVRMHFGCRVWTNYGIPGTRCHWRINRINHTNRLIVLFDGFSRARGSACCNALHFYFLSKRRYFSAIHRRRDIRPSRVGLGVK